MSRLLIAGWIGLSLVALSRAAIPGQHTAAGRDVEAQAEKDWVDDRWSRVEIGPFHSSVLGTPSGSVAKAISIKIGAKAEASMCFDSASCSWRAAWTDGFLKFDPSRFGLIRAPSIAGTVAWHQPSGRGWLDSSNRYTGLHLNGRRVVLEYTAGAMRVLDSPWLEVHDGVPVFTRSLELAPSANASRLLLAHAPNSEVRFTTSPRAARAVAATGPRRLAAGLVGVEAALTNEQGRVIATLPPHEATLRIKLWLCVGTNESLPFEALEKGVPENLEALAKPGPGRWLPEVTTVGQRGPDSELLAVDTLTVPYDNPWKALLFLSGVDFTPDGAGYVCTIHGDVWRVTGIDDALQRLRWKRFATGLHQPLGLKVRDGKIHVLGRDQITRLHDENGDGEADFFENFCNLIQSSTGAHDYVACLEQDHDGNFYYIDPKGVHRVSPDGRRRETVGTGWRNPNGMGVSPDGNVITAAPQQGEWTPSSQISEVKPGGYYGYGGPKVTADRALGYDPPLCWIPHRVDNSSGSQVWVPPDRWGPLGGQMLHLLWGRCGLMLVLRDQVEGTPQGAVVPLPGRFLSGPNRGTFRPADCHLYIAGSTGWQTSAAKDGALQRVRYTGKAARLPVAWHAHSNGLAVTFAQPLDRSAAEDAGSYGVKQWNYRYASQYGSKDWSVANPQQEGRDEVEVKSARLLGDGKTVFLEIPALRPVMQMEIKYSLATSDGTPMRGEFWLTLNKLGPPLSR